MNSKEIYNYIHSTGYNLSSDKILKQPENNQQTIWEIIVHLCSRIKNKNLQSTFATLIYMLEQPQKHQLSSKWLRQHMMVHQFLKKIKSDYGIIDYLRPQKQKIGLLLSKIVQVSKQIDRMNYENDELITKKDLNQKELYKAKATYQQISNQLQDLKAKKKIQFPLYEEKLKTAEALNGEIAYKKQQKLDILASQRELQEQINRKNKILEDAKYQNQNRKIKILQLKKEVTVNAPQIKKQKNALEEEFSVLSKEFYMEDQMAKSKQRTLINQIKKRDQFKDLLKRQSKTIIDCLQNVASSKEYVYGLQKDNSRLIQVKKQLVQRQSGITNQIQKLSNTNMMELKKCCQLRNINQQNLIHLKNKQIEAQKLSSLLKGFNESYQKRHLFQKSLQDKIAYKMKLYGLRKTQIQEEVESMRKVISQKCEQVYEVYLQKQEMNKMNPQNH